MLFFYFLNIYSLSEFTTNSLFIENKNLIVNLKEDILTIKTKILQLNDDIDHYKGLLMEIKFCCELNNNSCIKCQSNVNELKRIHMQIDRLENLIVATKKHSHRLQNIEYLIHNKYS
ncbi:hypothetical protein DMUE_2128 [Dictyocoela muelleri]|nr:hypothetical protein DMUE_2128 [Dictyocoela muelleri]